MKEPCDRSADVCWGGLCLPGLWRRRQVEPGTEPAGRGGWRPPLCAVPLPAGGGEEERRAPSDRVSHSSP